MSDTADKAKPRVIGGRLPAVIGGRPAAPNKVQAGKTTGPYSRDSRVAEATCLSTGRKKLAKPVVCSDYGFFYLDHVILF